MRTSTISTPETRVGNKSFQKKLFAARALRQAVIEGLEVRQLFSLSAVDRDAVEPLRLDSGVIQSATASLTTASSSTTAAVGTTLYNSNGFEPTRFQPGNLVGQDPVQGPWVKFGTPEVQVAASGGTVQPVVAATGNQSLRIDRLGADVRFAPFRAAPTAVGETIRMSYDLRVDAAPGAQPFGPFFGIEANSDNGTGGPVRVIGSVGIDAKTGELLVQRAVIGDFIAPGLVLSLNTFHNFKVDLDFLAQTYTVFVDGNPIPAFTGGFVDSTAGSPITSLSDADVAGLADAADAASLAAQGTAYVDNYKLTLLDSGTVVYDSQSFETPRFTSGDIVGQDPANGPWVRFGSTVVVPADATVQGTVALTGTRSLKVERNDGQDERFGPYREVTSVNEQVNIDWIMRVDLAAGPQTFGPYFGIEANNQEADGSVRLIGSAGVDAKTGEILFQRAGTGFLDTTGASVSLGVPHTFELQLNFVTQEYKLLVDSVVRVNETFVDSTALNPIKGFSDADIVALAAGGDAASQAANGVAYVDNYRVSLPEDGTQLYNSEGFEPPKFVDGDVVGQDPAQGVWIQFSGRNVIPGIATTLTGTATVQTAVTNGGVQGVRVDRQNGFDVRWAPFHPHDSIQDAVQLDWTMRVDAAPGAQPFGPFFGVEAYNDNGVGGPVRLIGSAGVDAKTGEVLFQEVGTGNLNTTGVTVSLNAFHAFRMILDFDRQRYMIYVDNTLVRTEPFVDATVGNPITGFSDADIAALAASSDGLSKAANGTAYFDNYAVSAVNTPVVDSIIVDDGNAQRSKVRKLTVKFDQPVTLTPGAFTLSRLNTGGSGLNNNSAPTDASAALGTPATSDGGITYVIPILSSTAFSDAFGSLQDAIYTLNIIGTNITNSSLQQLPGNQSATFHRLFGDITGDAAVNALDYAQFRNAFGSTTSDAGYNVYFDYNGDGAVNPADYAQFRLRFGKTFTLP